MMGCGDVVGLDFLGFLILVLGDKSMVGVIGSSASTLTVSSS